MPSGPATGRAKAPLAEPKADSQTALQSRIEVRAYELYETKGRRPGRELQDWLEAEQEILGEQMDTDFR